MLDFSLDNHGSIHKSCLGFDGDMLGPAALYVWHFSLDTSFCEVPIVMGGICIAQTKFGGWH